MEQALISSGIGLRLAFANLMLAVWVPLWLVDVHGTHIANTVLLGLAALGLLATVLYTYVKAAYRPDFRHRPFEWICVNMPVRMFLVVLLDVDVWQQLLMALNLDAAGGKEALARSSWPVFAIITGVSALSSFWILATTDFVWFASSVYLYVCVLLNTGAHTGRGGGGKAPQTLTLFAEFATAFKKDKDKNGGLGKNPIDSISHARPAEVLAALILAIALQTVAFLASVAWTRLVRKREAEGRIALPLTDEEREEASRAAAARRKRLGTHTQQQAAAAGGASRRFPDSARAPAQYDAEAEENEALLAQQQQQEPTPSQLERGAASNEVQGEAGPQVTRKLGH